MADSQKYRQPTDAEAGSVSADIDEPLEVNSTSGTTGRIANESTLSDVLSRLQALDDALASVGTDSLRTTLTGEPLDVSAATVPVEQQTPVQLGDQEATTNTASTTATGSGNAAAVDAPDGRTNVEVLFDTSGAATITVQTSHNGTDWFDRTTFSPGSAVAQAEHIQTGADHVRAFADQNLNDLTVSVKGT